MTSALLISASGCVTAPCLEEADDPDTMPAQQPCSLRGSLVIGRQKQAKN